MIFLFRLSTVTINISNELSRFFLMAIVSPFCMSFDCRIKQSMWHLKKTSILIFHLPTLSNFDSKVNLWGVCVRLDSQKGLELGKKSFKYLDIKMFFFLLKIKNFHNIICLSANYHTHFTFPCKPSHHIMPVCTILNLSTCKL